MDRTGLFQKKGKVSVWVGVQEPDVEAMQEIDILKDLCGVADYDVDDQEISGISESFPQAKIADLLGKFSYASTFMAPALQAADAKHLALAYWALAQFDFAYDPKDAISQVAAEPLFLGVFDWDDSEDGDEM